MGRRLSLPLVGTRAGALVSKPTLQGLRDRLGGPYEDPVDVALGTAVLVVGKLGVVLGSTPGAVDVWLGKGMVRRTSVDHLLFYDAALPTELAEVAVDICQFARLAAGQPVRYLRPHGEASTAGLLIEKCRFGGLVANDDGTIVALGFRRLYPAETSVN